MDLVDTSVWAQKRNPLIAQWFDAALIRNEIALCDQILLELLMYPMRLEDYRRVAHALTGVPFISMTAADWVRAREVQSLLAHQRRGQHKSVKIPDLLIAATAERAGLTLVHYDQDYETIGSVTGQSLRWVAERGTLQSGS
jgi:predicted nucleic acid-binding protein